MLHADKIIVTVIVNENNMNLVRESTNVLISFEIALIVMGRISKKYIEEASEFLRSDPSLGRERESQCWHDYFFQSICVDVMTFIHLTLA